MIHFLLTFGVIVFFWSISSHIPAAFPSQQLWTQSYQSLQEFVSIWKRSILTQPNMKRNTATCCGNCKNPTIQWDNLRIGGLSPNLLFARSASSNSWWLSGGFPCQIHEASRHLEKREKFFPCVNSMITQFVTLWFWKLNHYFLGHVKGHVKPLFSATWR